jgi:hypothetical protein
MTMTASGLAKLIEECGELLQVAGKKLAWYDTDEPHWDGSELDRRLEEELADVFAAGTLVIDALGLTRAAIYLRRDQKLGLFTDWHRDPTNNEHGVDAHIPAGGYGLAEFCSRSSQHPR